MLFVGTTTLTGGALSIRDIFLPMAARGDAFKGYLNVGLTAVMMGCVVLILADAVPRWLRHWREGRRETLSALGLPAAR